MRSGTRTSTDQPEGVRATALSHTASQSVVKSVSLKCSASSCCPPAKTWKWYAVRRSLVVSRSKDTQSPSTTRSRRLRVVAIDGDVDGIVVPQDPEAGGRGGRRALVRLELGESLPQLRGAPGALVDAAVDAERAGPARRADLPEEAGRFR